MLLRGYNYDVLVIVALSCRVHLGFMHEFLNTSCVTNLSFLTEAEDSPDCMLLRIPFNKDF